MRTRPGCEALHDGKDFFRISKNPLLTWLLLVVGTLEAICGLGSMLLEMRTDHIFASPCVVLAVVNLQRLVATAEGAASATVVAIEPCELLSLSRRDLLFFLRRHPDAAIQMLGLVAKRLAGVSELVEDTLFLNLPIRLAKKLVHFADSYGEETPDGLRLGLKLSQSEWGDLVGTTRESINKQFRAWTKAGLLSVDDGYIVIRRLEELERLADAALV